MKPLVLIAAMATLSACSAMEMEAEPDAAAGISASSAVFEAAFNSGDAAGVAALYTEDAVLLPPGAARVDGRDGVQALWQSYVDAKVTDIDLMTVSIDAHGDTATELGRFSIAVPDGKGGSMTVGGKYIVQWKLGADGVWRLQWDIWNNDPAG